MLIDMSTYSSPIEVVYDICYVFLLPQQEVYLDSRIFELFDIARSPDSILVIAKVRHTLRSGA